MFIKINRILKESFNFQNKTVLESKNIKFNVMIIHYMLRLKEFDPSSGWTLAVRLTHASRAVEFLAC